MINNWTVQFKDSHSNRSGFHVGLWLRQLTEVRVDLVRDDALGPVARGCSQAVPRLRVCGGDQQVTLGVLPQLLGVQVHVRTPV